VSSYALEAFRPHDRGDYLELLGDAWGHQGLSGDEFDWWFLRNPAGSLMSVARAGGRVVGVASHTLLRMVLGGREETASFSVHATTHPSMRGQGIFAGLEAKHEQEATERGVAVVLAFASAPTAPIFLGPLGWTEIGRLRVWARPLRGLLGRGKGLRERSDSLEVAGDAAAGWPNHVIRDAAHLRWRYGESPRGYRAVRSEAGYAVVGRRRQRGLDTAVLADFAASGRGARSLLREAAAAARGCQVMIALPAAGERATFASLGFVPTTTSLHFMGKALAGRLDTDPRSWRFTLGDTDFF
jgi:GNAT superfamily N-acetyltransferase